MAQDPRSHVSARTLPLITLEEHFISTSLAASPYGSQLGMDAFPPAITRKMLSLSAERLADMDSGAISLQVISHNPGAGSLPLDMCRQANDQLHQACQEHKTRFAGFAALPLKEPEAAAGELSRCVKELGFVGALISNHDEGRYYDDEFYWPVFARAQELDVPLYFHPAFPSKDKAAAFEGNFGTAAAIAMSAYVWGWHADVGLHIVRLFAAGVFDRFPRLKIIIGHMGEMLPGMVERIGRFSARWERRERGFMSVWRENIWITTSGMFTLAPLACLLRVTGVERVMFSVDYPLEENATGRDFVDEIRRSGLVNEQELEMIAFRNAERLLGLKVLS